MPQAQRSDLDTSARTLLARAGAGVLATIDPRDGTPYASSVELLAAPDAGGDVWMCLSSLAAHSTNLKLDARASVLVQDPLTHLASSALKMPRLTLLGRAERVGDAKKDDALREAWIARHPGAAAYLDFNDFHFYRLRVTRARYVGGFGQMGWLSGDEWAEAAPLSWALSVDAIIAHMNQDHADNLSDYAYAHTGWRPERAVMLGIDEHGVELELVHPERAQPVSLRLTFEEPVTRVELARAQLVKMARAARETLGDAASAQMKG